MAGDLDMGVDCQMYLVPKNNFLLRNTLIRETGLNQNSFQFIFVTLQCFGNVGHGLVFWCYHVT